MSGFATADKKLLICIVFKGKIYETDLQTAEESICKFDCTSWLHFLSHMGLLFTRTAKLQNYKNLWNIFTKCVQNMRSRKRENESIYKLNFSTFLNFLSGM